MRELYHKLIAILILVQSIGMQAQVTIGAGVPPHDGAALDLISNDNRGLLLPRLSLTAASLWSPLEGTPIEGMVVYNTNDTHENDLEGQGVYVWADNAWNILRYGEIPDCPKPAPPVSISISSRDIVQGKKLTVSTPVVSGATFYMWELPNGLAANSTSNTIEITAVEAGTYSAASIKVRAVNACGFSDALSGTGANIVVKSNKPEGEIDRGNAYIQGAVCFDVGQSNFNSSCGSQVSRSPAFSDASSRMRIYSVVFGSSVIMSQVTDLKVGSYNDPRGIIKSVTGDKASGIINPTLFVVQFADNINELAAGTSHYGGTSLTATLWASYKVSGAAKYVTLTITIQDCACCPMDGYLIPGGVYTGPARVANATDLSTAFTQVPNASLCVYPLDGYFGLSWNTASTNCGNGKYTPGEGVNTGWRLPNYMEARTMLQNHDLYGMNVNASNNYRYWVSTDVNDLSAYYITKNTVGGAYGVYSMSKTLTNNIGVRCVKSIGN